MIKKPNKEETIQIRITKTEKYDSELVAKSKGFDSLSAYIRYLLRKGLEVLK